MKKIMAFLLTLSICLNIYLIQIETIVNDDFESAPTKTDIVKVTQSSINLKCPEVQEKVVYKCNDEVQRRPPSDKIIEVQEEGSVLTYEDYQLKWHERLNDFLDLDLRIDQEKISSFYQLRARRNQEIDEALSEKLKKHMDENGQGSVYNFDNEDNLNIAKINLKYEKKLLDLFGEYNTKEYQRFKNAFNENQKRNSNNNFYIDF